MARNFCKSCGVLTGEEGTRWENHVCPRPGWTFRKWLNVELKLRKMSLDDLCRDARVTEDQIKEIDAEWKESIKPLLQTLSAIAKALDIPLIHVFHAGKMPTMDQYYDFFEKNLTQHLQLLNDENRVEAECLIDKLVASIINKQNKTMTHRLG